MSGGLELGRHDELINMILLVAMIGIAIATGFSLLRAILGPRATDRLISINLIGTKIIIIICLLAAYLREQYLIDVALIYALISFLSIVVLVNAYRYMRERQESKSSDLDDQTEDETQ